VPRLLNLENNMDQHPFFGEGLISQPPARKPRILVAPLDWGLGHATRCIPLVRALLQRDCEVLLAGEGAHEELLRKEFPSLTNLSLPGYRVRYGHNRFSLFGNLALQLPRALRTVGYERKWLREAVSRHQIDAVISDNRFGLFHEDIPCIFITHQLKVRSPARNAFAPLLRKINYHYINRFTECWVPDDKGAYSLAGALSQPHVLPKTPVHYLGPLSRFSAAGGPEKKDRLLVILSGPEPQRSILEEKLIRRLGHYGGSAAVVRGLPGEATMIPSSNMIRFYNHLPSAELEEELRSAEWVIARSGYSTVMDLMRMKKKSILIPTPGQTEQEYLGKFLSEKKYAFCVSQKHFDLGTALQQAREFSYHFPPAPANEQLNAAVDRLLKKVAPKKVSL